jgi:hypothetical protein
MSMLPASLSATVVQLHYESRKHTAPEPSAIERRAQWLFPDNEYMQREWLRAVAVVRSTKRGWLLDHPAEKKR